MKKCTLCGGTLDATKRCTFCGLDNTKNDDMYRGIINQNDCEDEPLTHVHEEPTYSRRPQVQLSKEQIRAIIIVIIMIIAVVFGMFEN